MLCFSVVLERLPTSAAATSSSADPPISNALMAALKRAQAHQRQGRALNRAEVIHLEKDLTEVVSAVEARIGNSGGGAVVLNLGDLKFLVEQPGQEAVAEVGKLLARFGGGDGRLWFIGTATCETYLRCQVYHPSMENDWDLQAVPIAARAPVPGLFPMYFI